VYHYRGVDARSGEVVAFCTSYDAPLHVFVFQNACPHTASNWCLVLGIVILHACRLDGTIMKRTAGVVGPALAQKIYTKQQQN
jgi:hypothetical protein